MTTTTEHAPNDYAQGGGVPGLLKPSGYSPNDKRPPLPGGKVLQVGWVSSSASTTPRHHLLDLDHAGDFFWYFPLPKGVAGWVGAQQRARGNEINTAVTPNGLLTCEIAVF